MLNTIKAIVREGKIVPLENVEFPEGASVLVTVLDDSDKDYWTAAGELSLNAVWGNDEDDVYAELLEK